MPSAGTPSGSVAYLTNSTTTLPKVTYVPLKAPSDEESRSQIASSGGAIRKRGFVRGLKLQPGEVDAVLNPPGARGASKATPDPLTAVLKPFEGSPVPSTLPHPSVFSAVADSEVIRFTTGLLAHRNQAVQAAQSQGTAPANLAVPLSADTFGSAIELANAAAGALNGLTAGSTSATSPIGMLNLERIEMTPAGIERGGLIATIPLAPKERTVVVQQEWSVITQEFSSITTDSLDNYSETGVTEATQLAQSTTSQVAHSNQFNINASVSGSYGFVTASVATGFASQNQNSTSAIDSRQHSVQTTRKASSRSVQSHKMTISTTTTTGSSTSNTRMIENPSATDPMRIDYFSIMRKWHCALYRYGLRLTYDITIPEPAAAMREAYAEIDRLQKKANASFDFDIKHSDITADVKPGQSEPYYLVLADQYSVDVPPPPSPKVILQVGPVPVGDPANSGSIKPATFTVPDDYWIDGIIFTDYSGQSNTDPFLVVGGSTSALTGGNSGHGVDLCAGQIYLWRQSGSFSITLLWTSTKTEDPNGFAYFNVNCVPTETKIAQWRSTVWSALYNAAQNQFLTQQQAITARIGALQNGLANIDTLTLRREENDEIMKCALRWLLGQDFEYMPQNVVNLFQQTAGPNVQYGVDFTGNDSGLSANNWSIVKQNLDRINFINQAIDWDNVIYYVYSYFWDVPQSWDFIRQIQHPDATRQAFLRAGSARVVLTVRKGWELAWTYFVEFGFTSLPNSMPPHPYLTIAQQIEDYDATNYPGIPPADPNGGGPIDDGTPQVGTTSTTLLAPSVSPVTIQVADSTGFIVGATAIIDAYESLVQENQPIVAVPDSTHITVGALSNAHDPAKNQNIPYPIVQAGESGLLIAEWFEYTPTSGTDIAVTSNLATIT
jgi:hypothetical protein